MKLLNTKTFTLLLSTAAIFSIVGCGGDGENGASSVTNLLDEGASIVVVPPIAPAPPIASLDTPAPAPAPDCIDGTVYEAITLNNGQIWLDRNLGASETSATFDSLAFGDLYQWGRLADGHEDRESTPKYGAKNRKLDPGYSDFIAGTIGFGEEWMTGGSESEDQGGAKRHEAWSQPASLTNTSQVCPCGYIVPSVQDYKDLNASGEIDKLLFQNAGWRETKTDGSVDTDNIFGPGKIGQYWTSDIGTSIGGANSFYVEIYDTISIKEAPERYYGRSVRCIKPASTD